MHEKYFAKPMTPAQIEAAEKKVGLEFPESYKQFLSELNGCLVDFFDSEAKIRTSKIERVQHIYAYSMPGRDGETGWPASVLSRRASVLQRKMPKDVLPIGDTWDNDDVLLSLRPDSYGVVAIFKWDRDYHPKKFPVEKIFNKRRVASDFEEIASKNRIYEPLSDLPPLPMSKPIGEPVSDEAIAAFEKKFGGPLPDSYRKFVQTINGCRMPDCRRPRSLQDPPDPYADHPLIEWLLPLEETVRRELLIKDATVEKMTEKALEGTLPHGFIVIGHTQWNERVVLSLADESYGRLSIDLGSGLIAVERKFKLQLLADDFAYLAQRYDLYRQPITPEQQMASHKKTTQKKTVKKPAADTKAKKATPKKTAKKASSTKRVKKASPKTTVKKAAPRKLADGAMAAGLAAHPEVITFGTPLSESQVAEFETEIGYKLPDDYRQFLLEVNGCDLPSVEFDDDDDDYDIAQISGLYALNREGTTKPETDRYISGLGWSIRELREEIESETSWPDYILPIGEGHYNETFCICLHPKAFGVVLGEHWMEGNIAVWFDVEKTVLKEVRENKIADSFVEAIEKQGVKLK